MENLLIELQKQLNNLRRVEIINLNIEGRTPIYQTRVFRKGVDKEDGYYYHTNMAHLCEYSKIVDKLMEKTLIQNDNLLEEVIRSIKNLTIGFSTEFELTDNSTIFLILRNNSNWAGFIREIKNEATYLKTSTQHCRDFQKLDYLEEYNCSLFDIEEEIISDKGRFQSEIKMIKMLDRLTDKNTDIKRHTECINYLEMQLEKVGVYKDDILRKFSE